MMSGCKFFSIYGQRSGGSECPWQILAAGLLVCAFPLLHIEALKRNLAVVRFPSVFVILFKVESTQHPTHQLPVDWQSLGESSLDPARDTKIIYSYNYTNTEGSKCSRILLQEPGSRLANWMQLWGFAAWNSYGSRSI